jgi:small-conductance mechanosensitive channel
MAEREILGIVAWHWAALLGVLGLGFAVGTGVMRLFARLAKRTEPSWDDLLVERLNTPARLVCSLLFLRGAVEVLELGAKVEAPLGRVLGALLIIALAWAVERSLYATSDALAQRYEASTPDPAAARAARTRILVLRRMAAVLVALVATALVLTQFDLARQVGMSLLASAGLAGVVVGFAAQKSLAALFAGLQMSISQPARIGDAIVIEGEFGWIEEITLTYVVVRVWDNRRLVLPIAHLLEKPFQNWTRTSPELLGTVFLHADYAVPVEALREELKRACEEDPAWDKKAVGLVVSNATDTTLELRATVSAEDASKLWDLRCRVRERLVAKLASMEGGRYLPRTRFEEDRVVRAEKGLETGPETGLPALVTPPRT